jgi:hypothetical protein
VEGRGCWVMRQLVLIAWVRTIVGQAVCCLCILGLPAASLVLWQWLLVRTAVRR